jgi:hypothetical protein
MSETEASVAGEPGQEISSAPREPGFLLTSFAMFGGITLWITHLTAESALVPAACDHSLVWLLNLLTVLTAIGAALAIAAGEVLRRRYVAGEGVHAERTHLVADLAIIFNVASLALILLEGYPVLVLDPCTR